MAEIDPKEIGATRKEAVALGLKFYWGKRQCHKGHDCPRRLINNGCLDCQREKTQEWRNENRERATEWNRSYRNKNKDHLNELERIRYDANPDKFRNKTKSYYRRNTEKVKAKARIAHHAKAADEEFKEAARERTRKWVEANPEKARHNAKISQNKRRAIENDVEGTFTTEDIVAIFKAQKGKCAYCRKSLSKGFEIDHIVPISKKGTNWPNNLQLLCKKIGGNACNQKKGAKDPIDFARSRGMLL